MEREQIIRDDFPAVRKGGWDPDAVSAHLAAIADSGIDAKPPPAASLGHVAADRIRGVLEAAEAAAAEIRTTAEADAQRQRREAGAEAESIRATARTEADELLAGARANAGSHLSEARAAVEGLVSEAEGLRAKVAELGVRLAGSAPETSPAPTAEVPGPATIPEPTPPTIPEPSPDPVPEPTPDPVPEPTPDPAPSPDPTPPGPDPGLPDEPGPLEPPTPEPAPLPPAAAPAVAASKTTEDLIAQLKAGGSGGAANGSAVAAAVSGSDLGAARLVAMNMALDGAPREDISAQIEGEFGRVPDLGGLLDEVLARVGR